MSYRHGGVEQPAENGSLYTVDELAGPLPRRV